MKKLAGFLWVLFLLLAPQAIAQAAETDNFTLRPGDILQITVWKEEGLDREVLVLQDGTVNFPLAGTIQAQGLTTHALEEKIKDKLKDSVPDASVIVAVKNPAGHAVSVIGQVTKPGSIIMAQRLTVMQALSEVGGLTPYASEDNITILREGKNGKTSLPYPYSDIARGKHLEQDTPLEPGDVIVVPTAGLF